MSERKPRLNVKLLNRIKKHITKHPDAYDQASWAYQRQEGRVCNTFACIGGWAVFLSVSPRSWKKVTRNWNLIEWKAQKLLGLTSDEAMRLFDTQHTNCGPEGAVEGCAKIDALIESRKTVRV